MHAVVRRTDRLRGKVTIAGSKNYTSRYILAAALAPERSVIQNPAPIDDAHAMAECCSQLGATVDTTLKTEWHVEGTDGRLWGPARLNVRNAGAVTRFLMAVCATSPEPVELYTPYPDSLGRRPQQDLLDALQQLGAEVTSQGGRLPVTVRRGELKAGPVDVSGATSSQYLTGLLFLAPLLDGVTEIAVRDTLRSRPAIEQTLDVLRTVGIQVEAAEDLMHFRVVGPQQYRNGVYRVPGDWPSAAAILCAAAVTESNVVVEGVFEDAQGEYRILDVLRQMGAQVDYNADQGRVHLRSSGRLRPVRVDGDLATDAVLSMVAAACFADGTSHFFNLHTLRHKESDRISDFCGELRKCGVKVDEGPSEIVVHGSGELVPGGAEIEAHHDHRIIMALTTVGLRSEAPLVIRDAWHVAKSYPDFFQVMQALGADTELTGTQQESG